MSKRVCCLYRVSTGKQVDYDANHEADIPMQRKACHKFADSMGWQIVHEEQEDGVSGHKVRAEARDKLQAIKEMALKKEFDILLVFLIAAANVFNTIYTNITLRRRELAMLRSVGLSNKGIRRMMDFESLIYGLCSLLLGLPASGAVTYLIYSFVNREYEVPFTLPWGNIAFAVASIFLVVFASMLYATSRIKKDNPIDALKNENV